MDVIETIWHVPAVVHFVYLFREAYKLPEISYEELEEALLTITGTNELGIESSNVNSEIKNEDPLNQMNRTIYKTTFLTNEPKDILVQLICSLLRGCFTSEITYSNWELYLVKIFDSTDENQTSPFFEKRVNNEGNVYDHFIPFHEQPLEKKAQILYELCEHRLYSKDRPHKIDELEDDELRVEPIGQDSDGCFYWYFFGTRLYKENPKLARKIEEKKIKINRLQKLELRTLQISKRSKLSNKKNNSLNQTTTNISKVGFTNNEDLKDLKDEAKITMPEISIEELQESWSCICKTEQEWIQLTEKFKNSKNTNEKELHNILSENFLPNINQLFIKIEKNNQRKLRFLNQRNSCRLMAKRFQAEEEERVKEQEKGNERENRAKRRAG